MKNYQLAFLTSCLLLTSCVAAGPSYFGDKLAPTTNVDIFYAAHDVKRDYKVIGHMNYPNFGQELVKQKFVAYAKTIGADAIIITGSTIDNGTKTGSDVVNADALKYSN